MTTLTPKITFSNGVSMEFGIDDSNQIGLTLSSESFEQDIVITNISLADIQKLARVISIAAQMYQAIVS